MTFDPGNEARNIANRAKLRAVYEQGLAEGNIDLHSMRKHIVRKIQEDIKREMVYDFIFSTDENIQKTFDRVERFKRGLQFIDSEIAKLPPKNETKCGRSGCDSESHVHVLKMDVGEFLKTLFDR